MYMSEWFLTMYIQTLTEAPGSPGSPGGPVKP